VITADQCLSPIFTEDQPAGYGCHPSWNLHKERDLPSTSDTPWRTRRLSEDVRLFRSIGCKTVPNQPTGTRSRRDAQLLSRTVGGQTNNFFCTGFRMTLTDRVCWNALTH
jgi:hypothetical protein